MNLSNNGISINGIQIGLKGGTAHLYDSSLIAGSINDTTSEAAAFINETSSLYVYNASNVYGLVTNALGEVVINGQTLQNTSPYKSNCSIVNGAGTCTVLVK
jgi:hypothetical protein